MSKGTVMTIIQIRVKTAVSLEPLTSRTNLNREKSTSFSKSRSSFTCDIFFFYISIWFKQHFCILTLLLYLNTSNSIIHFNLLYAYQANRLMENLNRDKMKICHCNFPILKYLLPSTFLMLQNNYIFHYATQYNKCLLVVLQPYMYS